jgi:hypothetical protein
MNAPEIVGRTERRDGSKFVTMIGVAPTGRKAPVYATGRQAKDMMRNSVLGSGEAELIPGIDYRAELIAEGSLKPNTVTPRSAIAPTRFAPVAMNTNRPGGMTPRQEKYIRDLMTALAATDKADIANGMIARFDSIADDMPYAKITQTIDYLKRQIASATVTTNPIHSIIPDVANGRYALKNDGVIKFYRVKHGKASGKAYVNVIAGDSEFYVPNGVAILTAIAQDAKAAMSLYGMEIGKCGHCNRTLTDEASRAAGIGPVCAAKM